MKLNKNIFICALLALILLMFIGAASASDTLEDNLATNTTGDDVIGVSDAEDALSEGNTITVDGGGDGKISAAVSSAGSGDTIYIKNGEYTDSLTFTKSVNLVGESKDGVSIKTGSSSALLATVSGDNPLLSFENITFKDSARTSSGVISFMGSGDVSFTNCNFVDLSSKYGAIQTNTAGTITISKCTFDNIKEKSNSPGTGLMYLNGAGTTNIYDCVIKNCGYEASSGQMNALIYEYGRTGKLNIERTTIVNTTGSASSLIRSAGKVNIKDSVITNNIISLSSTGYVGDSLFYVTGELNIETSIIANNTGPKLLLYKNTAADFKMNYCNLQDNTFDGGFTDAASGDYDANNNYWGSNDLPSDVTASTWIVNNNGVYEYNNGDALDVTIPGLNDGGDEPVAEGTIFVSTAGNDANDGLSKDTAVKSIARAIEIAENGKIIVLAGTYTIDATLTVAKDLDITGQGDVVIDGNSKGILANTANLNLTNIAFTNGKASFASAILNDGNMTITNCLFYSNQATGSSSGNIINNRKGSMTIDNSKFYENVASRGAVASQSGTTLLIKNSEFYDNDMTSISTTYGIIYSSAADTVVENTIFRNNKAKTGGAIYATRTSSGSTGTLEVINCTFDNNTALQGQGGAIFAGRTPTTIKDSTFTNNQAISGSYAKGQGGAIYQTIADPLSTMSVENSVFINNTAGDAGSAVYVNTDQGTFDITNSIIINKEGDDTFAIDKKEGATTVITADNNYWGNNTKVNFDLDEDSQITLDVALTVDDEATGAVTITAKFSKDLPDGIELTFSTDSGSLDKTVSYDNAGVTVTGNVGETDRDVLVSVNGIPQFKVSFGPVLDVIYVSSEGKDTNDGSLENPVATIERALQLAKKGQIVVLEGTYKVSN
ncbi:right-handed parallel beta-helix repeat-containing protein, partial [Methanobrevibacter sp.]|uniref:right-handed parallel beta-helix repeat-containing protein n=1 Tax=Methanobrevibacter sp. TaxID=66852 RepID=UPI0038664B48